MRKFLFTISLLSYLTSSTLVFAENLNKIIDSFVQDFREAAVPELTYSYVENFQNILDLTELLKRQSMLLRYENRLAKIDPEKLDSENVYLYKHLKFEISFNLERVRLEIGYKNDYPELLLPADGLYQLPFHDQWFNLYLRFWTSSTMTANDLLVFGKSEVERINQEINAIQAELGFAGDNAGFKEHLADPRFRLRNLSNVENHYQSTMTTVLIKMVDLFEESKIPSLDIRPIPDPDKDSPPGYYHRSVFYFNFFGQEHNSRQVDWLFIHEAIPGHHFQSTFVEIDPQNTPFRDLFWYPGFSEGWGAYAETLGTLVGLYQSPYQQLGKWEWDIVRSARIVMDIGINLEGWSDSRALQYWRENVRVPDSIAMREIRRMRRWPVQVHSYKAGEKTILQLRAKAQLKQGVEFDVRKFHTAVLKRGSIPLDILDSI